MSRAVLVAGLAVVAGMAGAPAAFGSCSPDHGDPRESLDESDGAIFGEVLEVRNEPGRTVYRVRVIERFKGDFSPETEIETRTSGSFPGSGASLYVGQRTGILLTRVDGSWRTQSCDTRSREHLRAGLKAPRSRSRGPVRFVVAGRFGAPRAAALDARGRLVKLGAGEGDVTRLAPCPGGRRVLEAVQLPDLSWSLAVREVATMRVLGTLALDLEPGREGEQPTALRCDAADGGSAQVGVMGPHGHPRLVSVAGGAARTIWRVEGEQRPSSGPLLGRRYAWVIAGGRLLRIDPQAGATTDLGERRPRDLLQAVSPDESRLVITSWTEPEQMTLVDAATGATVHTVDGTHSNEVYWLDRRSLAFKTYEELWFGDDLARRRATSKTGGAVTVHDARLWIVRGRSLRSYDRHGRTAGPRRRLFTESVGVVAVLPRPVRLRASAARLSAWQGVRPPSIA